jgi:hypothetical protein
LTAEESLAVIPAADNFTRTLPAPQSDPTRETIKDPYMFDFLSLGPDISERELHRSLVERLRGFLIEPGVGFGILGGGQSAILQSVIRTIISICSSTIPGSTAMWSSN